MKIIYISGIDGCGKTTQSTLLCEKLQANNISTEYQWLRWEPSIVPLLKRIKNLTGKPKVELGKSDKALTKTEDKHHGRWTELKTKLMASGLFKALWLRYSSSDYFTSYRKASVNWKSDYVILDRYLHDFVVDQALNFSLPVDEYMAKLSQTALAGMQKPDYLIIIDLPAQVGYDRKLDGTPLEYLREREAMYNSINDGDNVLHLDGTLPLEQIHTEIVVWLSDKIGELQ
ncbi:MAG: hypothetical protein GY814_00885 [Gammaproteobacteria bacterium]|nr:hypothetical protein [Gammaproteobacteria bacterium]